MEIKGTRFDIDGIKFELIKEPESQIEFTNFESTDREFIDGPTKDTLWLVSDDGNTKTKVSREAYADFVEKLMVAALLRGAA